MTSTAHHQGGGGANNPAAEGSTMTPLRLSDDETAHLRDIGAILATIRLADEALVVVSVGARAPDYDCDEGSVEATVTTGGETATAAAAGTDLATALLLARGKALRQIEAREKKRRRDTDGSPKGTDAQRQDGEAATAGAGGIAHTGASA